MNNPSTNLQRPSRYNLPLQLIITGTYFSIPENYIKRKDGGAVPTDIRDTRGVWMNAGKGGDNNTIDVVVELRDSRHHRVTSCPVIPIGARIWTVDAENKLCKPLEEIRSDQTSNKSGHIKSNYFMRLYINDQGRGKVCIKILATSHQFTQNKFSIELFPEVEKLSERVQRMFSTQRIQPRESVLNYRNLSTPVEVMTKVNNLNTPRDGEDHLVIVSSHIRTALSVVDFEFTSILAKENPELFQGLVSDAEILFKKLKKIEEKGMSHFSFELTPEEDEPNPKRMKEAMPLLPDVNVLEHEEKHL
eukprot:snap_masked-scaffold_4-processed-gene-18.42-mRNA-1 protein AED:1.00 eAED:1.00 QI:0/0/0/0/1/1/2/0/303